MKKATPTDDHVATGDALKSLHRAVSAHSSVSPTDKSNSAAHVTSSNGANVGLWEGRRPASAEVVVATPSVLVPTAIANSTVTRVETTLGRKLAIRQSDLPKAAKKEALQALYRSPDAKAERRRLRAERKAQRAAGIAPAVDEARAQLDAARKNEKFAKKAEKNAMRAEKKAQQNAEAAHLLADSLPPEEVDFLAVEKAEREAVRKERLALMYTEKCVRASHGTDKALHLRAAFLQRRAERKAKDARQLATQLAARYAIRHGEQTSADAHANVAGSEYKGKKRKPPRLLADVAAKHRKGNHIAGNTIISTTQRLTTPFGSATGLSTRGDTVAMPSGGREDPDVAYGAHTRAPNSAVPYKVRMLVCAPSNAAVDEVVSRLLALPSDVDLARSLLRASTADDQSDYGAHRTGITMPPTLVGISPLRGGSSHVSMLHDVNSQLLGDDSNVGAGGGGGLLDESGSPWVPYVVRIGARNFVSDRPEVQDRMLSTLSHRRLRILTAKAVAAHPSNISTATPVLLPYLASRLYELRATRERILRLCHDIRTELGTHRRATDFTDAFDVNAGATALMLSAVSSRLVDSAIAFARGAVDGQPSGVDIPWVSGTAAHRAMLLLRMHYLQREAGEATAEAEFIIASSLVGQSRMEDLQVRAVRDVLSRADVVVATLTGCASLNAGAVQQSNSRGRHIGEGDVLPLTLPEVMPLVTFDAFIIDEAGQAIEPDALTPLRHAYTGHTLVDSRAGPATPMPVLQPSTRRLILVGDPLQLPATVKSHTAKTAGLDVSFFERLAGAGIRPLLLTTQYRMTSVVAAFSASHFYRGFVKDAPQRHSAPSPEGPSTLPCACRSPLILVDVPQGRETRGSAQSYGNDEEVSIVVALIRHLTSQIGNTEAATASTANNAPLTIGVITPYAEQVARIRRGVRSLGGTAASTVFISTVDGFQGGERDIIIISAVRSRSNATGHSTGIGFVADPRRLNVAVTRAKQSLIIIGNLEWLSSSSPDWHALLNYGAAHGVRLAAGAGQEHSAQHGTVVVSCDEFSSALRGTLQTASFAAVRGARAPHNIGTEILAGGTAVYSHADRAAQSSRWGSNRAWAGPSTAHPHNDTRRVLGRR